MIYLENALIFIDILDGFLKITRSGRFLFQKFFRLWPMRTEAQQRAFLQHLRARTRSPAHRFQFRKNDGFTKSFEISLLQRAQRTHNPVQMQRRKSEKSQCSKCRNYFSRECFLEIPSTVVWCACVDSVCR